jgi:hypothetical protein
MPGPVIFGELKYMKGHMKRNGDYALEFVKCIIAKEIIPIETIVDLLQVKKIRFYPALRKVLMRLSLS